MATAARKQQRTRAMQPLQEALCTVPATRKAAAAPAAATRAAARPGGSLCTAPATRKATAAPAGNPQQQLVQAGPGGSVSCTCHTKGSRGPRGGHARRSSLRTVCVLSLPRDRQPRPAAISEKKKAFKRSYCLYFKEEGSLETKLLPLF